MMIAKRKRINIVDVYNIMSKCPECDKEADTYAAMKSHIVNKHRDIPADEVEPMLNGIGLYSRKDMKNDDTDTGYVNKREAKTMADDENDELNGLDELEQLREIIKSNGVKDSKANAIINLFQHYDIDDLKKLQSTLVKAGVNRNSRAMILETWAAQRELPDDEIPSEKSKSDGEDDYESQLMKDMGMDDQLKDAMAAAKKRQAEINVARRLQAMGIDPSIYGLPAPPQVKKDDDDDDDKMEFEWPPDSGTMRKMTPERYNSLLYGWNKAHGKVGNMDDQPARKENMIPWFDPYGEKTIDVPVSQYSQYMAITQQYHREKDSRTSPEIEEIKRDLKDKDNLIQQLVEDRHNRELNEISGQAQAALQKNDKLERELEEFRGRDPMDDYEVAAKKLREKAELFGLGPRSLSVQEQSLLKKQEVQAESATTAIQTIAKKVADNKLGSGMLMDKLISNFQQPLNDALRESIKSRRSRKGQAQPPTDEQINEMYERIENPEIQEEMGNRRDIMDDGQAENDNTYENKATYNPIDQSKYGVSTHAQSNSGDSHAGKSNNSGKKKSK